MPSQPDERELLLSDADCAALRALPMREAIAYWDAVERDGEGRGSAAGAVRLLVKADLFYLLVRACRRVDMLNEFAFARCREVEASPDGHCDLWAREHFKSSVITFGKTIQDILRDPEVTFGIFSHTRPIAKAFLRQIMRELESNRTLHAAFPDVLWGQDVKQSPKWALDVDTPVLTIHGWKRHGDLATGDRIYGSRGQVITVTGNSGPMEGAECRRVVFDDGELVASSDHLWPVQCKTMAGVKWNRSKLRILKTDQLRRAKTMRMLATPVIHPPEGQYDPPIVDPYVLGLWLGDGTAGTNIISMHRDDENETLKHIHLAGFETYVHRRKADDNFSMYGVRGLKEKLTEIGCVRQKVIPDRYLFASADERLALLQGMMDSDGTCKKRGPGRAQGMCMFSNTNIALADGVFHLASSLGLRPSILNFIPKRVGKQRVYHVYFVGVKYMPPFRLLRKLEHCKDKRIKDGRYLRTVIPIPSVIVNCIKVDSVDSLYLAGCSMIPTHNSEDDGIIVKRRGNPNEATVEAWGLVDGQPVSKHFKVLLYDDIVVQASVTTPEMIAKTMARLEESYSLGVTPGGRRRFAGTRWHFNDAYRTVVARGTAAAREHPGREGGTEEGASVYWPEEIHVQKRRDFGPYTYAAQILLNPKADAMQGFKREWLRYYRRAPDARKMNTYIVVDSANSKRKESDYTSMWVIGLGTDGNYYALDMVRDRLNLTERTDRLFTLHRKWKPKQVRWERYGMMADIEHIKREQESQSYRFDVTEVAGQTSKDDRIKRMLPIFEQGKFYLPESLHVTDWQKTTHDLVHDFIEEEYYPFPVSLHKDMMDSLSRIAEPDLALVWPKEEKVVIDEPLFQGAQPAVAWMA